jgi:hypothetical protein
MRGVGFRMPGATALARKLWRKNPLHEEQNPKGRAFYRKLGFGEVGVKTDEVAGAKVSSIVLEKCIGGDATI